ncbi:MAG: hypothetical protein ABI589_13895 [Burkholderiales bacterium]
MQALLAGAAAFALPLSSTLAVWPEKPIKLTFTAGGGSDIVARVLADHLSKKLGQPVVVDGELGIVAKPKSVAEYQKYVKEQVEVLGPTVKGAGVKL